MAEGRKQAETALMNFAQTYEAKYPKATRCLTKDQECLLVFYDFPAEHWVHIRTTSPIESTCATIRHRTNQAKGCVSRTTILTMIYKLGMCAEKRWRKLRGFAHLVKVIEGLKLQDGIEVNADDEEDRDAA